MSIDPIINETLINIILDTNIPGENPISFTKNVLHNPLLKDKDEYSEYPFFSWWIPYPREVLVKMDYSSQVDFFFKKDEFIRILKNTDSYQNFSKQMNQIKLTNIKTNQPFQTNIANNLFLLDKTEKNDNIRNNVMVMLTLLFPTSFPTNNNIINTYDTLFWNLSNKSSVSSIIPLLLNLTLGVESNKPKYSYIQIPSKGVCTVTQLAWLNDIYNHPEYKKIILEYQSFQIWKSTEKSRLNLEIEKEMGMYKDENKIGKIWNELLKKVDSMDENNIPKTLNISYYGYSRQQPIIHPQDDFKKMKQILNNKDNVINSKKYNDLFNLKNYVNNVNKTLDKTLSLYNIKNIQNLFVSIEKIQVNYNIINKFLDNDFISFDTLQNKNMDQFMTDDEVRIDQKVKQWTGYAKYNNFINLLNIFNRSNNESTNDLLQTTIDNFTYGNSQDNNFELLLNPSNSKNKKIINLVETGITIKKTNNVANTIYVRMDVIIGEVNDSNKNQINCVYNKDYLGSELESLLKSSDKFWELNQNRFLFDLNNMKTIDINDKPFVETKPTSKKNDINPYNSMNAQNPYNSMNAQNPYNSMNAQNPYNSMNAQNPYNSMNRKNPYSQNSMNTYLNGGKNKKSRKKRITKKNRK